MTDQNQLYAQLAGLGLTENDSRVYIFLLERGVAFGGSKIAARLGMHRQYVHNSLQKLLEMELVEEVHNGTRPTSQGLPDDIAGLRGARRQYKALPPQQLSHMARKQLDAAEHTVRELDLISTVGAEQDFEAYRGRRQVLEFEERLVDGLKDDEVQYIIGGGSETFVNFFGEQYEEISRVAAKKGLKTLYVGNPGEVEWLRGRVAGVFGDRFQVRLLDTLPKTIVQTVIRFDTVTFYAFGNPPLVYFLKSKTVAEDYKKFFMMLWDMAK